MKHKGKFPALDHRITSIKTIRSLWFILPLCVLFSACHDRVLFTNAANSGEIGILLDGNLNGTFVNDQAFTSAFNGHVDPGTVTSGVHNEVIAFQSMRPPTIVENANWTNGDEDVTVAFPNTMGLAFTVWLLQGPVADRTNQAIAACIKLDEIWTDERMGTRIAGFQINDKISDPNSAGFLDFTCGNAADMRTKIGFNSNTINIYYVNRVDFGTGFSTGNGVWCGNNTVVMGSNASDHLAAHETGHAFGLDHVNSLTTNFDVTNVMHNASNTRRFLTEGQTFRAHFDPGSVINTTYILRPGLPTRSCGSLNENPTNDCPEIQKRIWADGTFPAN